MSDDLWSAVKLVKMLRILTEVLPPDRGEAHSLTLTPNKSGLRLELLVGGRYVSYFLSSLEIRVRTARGWIRENMPEIQRLISYSNAEVQDEQAPQKPTDG